MTISSMTGFARAEGHDASFGWVWELKSVNAKSLDLRFRLPAGFEAIEQDLRASLSEKLRRGAVTANLVVTKATGVGALRVNREALDAVMKLARELGSELEAAPPRIDGLLALKGVLESAEETEDPAAREKEIERVKPGFARALAGLAAMRLAEGARLQAVLEARLDEIAALRQARGSLGLGPARGDQGAAQGARRGARRGAARPARRAPRP